MRLPYPFNSLRRPVCLMAAWLGLAAPPSPVSAAAAGARSAARPVAKVGAYYFDGWAWPHDPHLNGWRNRPAFAGRKPLSGWLDNTRGLMRQQLLWAHRDGISFFIFDWYYGHGRPLPLNHALYLYRGLRRHVGVRYALLYVNVGRFVIPPRRWRAVVTFWTRHYFRDRSYQRINGRPVLVIIDVSNRFLKQFRGYDGGRGRTGGANRALAVLQGVARAHGLPGVFVVGGVLWGEAYPQAKAFPSFSWLRGLQVNALSEYNYPYGGGAFNGPRPYRYLVQVGQWAWGRFAAVSPLPYIPVVMDGWDPRPWKERAAGKLGWYRRTPAEFGGFVRRAIVWVRRHPRMRLSPPPHRPVIFIEAWNELGEGSYMLPTVGDGNQYGQALAHALGVAR
jgi:hypothetical protein